LVNIVAVKPIYALQMTGGDSERTNFAWLEAYGIVSVRGSNFASRFAGENRSAAGGACHYQQHCTHPPCSQAAVMAMPSCRVPDMI